MSEETSPVLPPPELSLLDQFDVLIDNAHALSASATQLAEDLRHRRDSLVEIAKDLDNHHTKSTQGLNLVASVLSFIVGRS